VDGAPVEGVSNFTPLLASASVLGRFFNQKENSEVSMDAALDAVKLLNDMTFRKKAEETKARIDALPSNSAERKKLQDALSALNQNIDRLPAKRNGLVRLTESNKFALFQDFSLQRTMHGHVVTSFSKRRKSYTILLPEKHPAHRALILTRLSGYIGVRQRELAYAGRDPENPRLRPRMQSVSIRNPGRWNQEG
jgi:hypothetical protein